MWVILSSCIPLCALTIAVAMVPVTHYLPLLQSHLAYLLRAYIHHEFAVFIHCQIMAYIYNGSKYTHSYCFRYISYLTVGFYIDFNFLSCFLRIHINVSDFPFYCIYLFKLHCYYKLWIGCTKVYAFRACNRFLQARLKVAAAYNNQGLIKMAFELSEL